MAATPAPAATTVIAAAPSSLTVVVDGATAVASWGVPAGALDIDGYQVHLDDEVHDVAADVTSFTFDDLAAGEDYLVQVVAVVPGASGRAAAATFSTPFAETERPRAAAVDETPQPSPTTPSTSTPAAAPVIPVSPMPAAQAAPPAQTDAVAPGPDVAPAPVAAPTPAAAPAPDAAARRVTLTGTFTVHDYGSLTTLVGGYPGQPYDELTGDQLDQVGDILEVRLPAGETFPCPEGAGGGFDDLAAGARVTVRDGANAILATTELTGGVLSLKANGCTFDFVANLPDADFYAVEVAQRGSVTYSRQELEAEGWTVATSV